MITPEDKVLLEKKGISEAQIAEQLACFEKGFPFLQLDGAASIEKGILVPTEAELNEYLNAWDAYKGNEKSIVKFVPASGAASRMFKNMFEFMNGNSNVPTTDFEKKYFDEIEKFAFYNALNAVCVKNHGKDIATLKDKELSNLRLHEIGFILQTSNLMPYLNVLDNLLLLKKMAGKVTKQDEAFAKELLIELGLSSKFEKFFEFTT